MSCGIFVDWEFPGSNINQSAYNTIDWLMNIQSDIDWEASLGNFDKWKDNSNVYMPYCYFQLMPRL